MLFLGLCVVGAWVPLRNFVATLSSGLLLTDPAQYGSLQVIDTWFLGLMTFSIILSTGKPTTTIATPHPTPDALHHRLSGYKILHVLHEACDYWGGNHSLLLIFWTSKWCGFSPGWCRTACEMILPRVPNGTLEWESLCAPLLLSFKLEAEGKGRVDSAWNTHQLCVLLSYFSFPILLPSNLPSPGNKNEWVAFYVVMLYLPSCSSSSWGFAAIGRP